MNSETLTQQLDRFSSRKSSIAIPANNGYKNIEGSTYFQKLATTYVQPTLPKKGPSPIGARPKTPLVLKNHFQVGKSRTPVKREGLKDHTPVRQQVIREPKEAVLRPKTAIVKKNPKHLVLEKAFKNVHL